MTSSLHDFLCLAERNLYEIANFTRTKGWEIMWENARCWPVFLICFFLILSRYDFGAPSGGTGSLPKSLRWWLANNVFSTSISMFRHNIVKHWTLWWFGYCVWIPVAALGGCIPTSFLPSSLSCPLELVQFPVWNWQGPAEKLIRSFVHDCFLERDMKRHRLCRRRFSCWFLGFLYNKKSFQADGKYWAKKLQCALGWTSAS